MKRKIFICFCLINLFMPCISADSRTKGTEDKTWHLLESAKIKMEEKEFGEALLMANKAAELHKKKNSYQYNYLFGALKPSQVKKTGDNLFDVYHTFELREDFDACKILDEIFLTHPPVFFNKSVSALMKWLKEKAAFPDGDYITGKIYFAQGEYLHALSYFEKAWENRNFLEVPEERFNIIYSIADCAKILQKYDLQEKYLLLVLTEDSAYGTTGEEGTVLKAMLHTIAKEKNTAKFFKLYRNENMTALKAYKDLTEIYMQAENTKRALSAAALAANIALTGLSAYLEKADFSYTYSGLKDVLIRCGKNSGILSWAEQKDLWEVFINFADALGVNGYEQSAADLYYTIAESVPSIDYAQRALYKLAKQKQHGAARLSP